MTRVCECAAHDPAHGLPYKQWLIKANELHKRGYTQVRCPKCRRLTVWKLRPNVVDRGKATDNMGGL